MIIAEIGQNFQGDLQLALELIIQAHKSGADLVKFQLYDSKKLYGEYQNTELTFQNALFLFNAGAYEGIEVFFSVFDTERVKWCEEIGVKRYKIASSENRNKPLLEAVSNTAKEYFISNDSLDLVLPGLPEYGKGVKRLYCVANYPTKLEQLHLRNVVFDSKVSYCYFDGLSDHTIGLDCAKIALSRGATIIEKHFSLDHHTGVDAEWSMDASELKELKRFELVCKQVL